MDRIIDAGPNAHDQQAREAGDIFRNCIEVLRTPGGGSIVDIYYGDDGSQLASRITRPGSKEFNFKVDDQSYQLKQGAIANAGLYRIKQENGDTISTPVASGTDEFNKALAAIRKINFDTAPLC